jgi:hypothetical protein
MRRSETIGQLADALAKAQKDIRVAVKDATNPHFKASYADLASVRAACYTQLAANGIAVAQSPEANGPSVTVTTLLAHSSGEWLEGALTLQARDASPQAVGSAITYGRRYGLASMVGVAPDDDDGEAAQPSPRKARESRKAEEPQERVHVTAGVVISEAQRKRLYTIASTQHWSTEDTKALLKRFGFDSSKDVTVDKYDAIVAAIETGEAVP